MSKSPIVPLEFIAVDMGSCAQIQGWIHKALMCDFNLVAVPMHSSLLQDSRRGHPFRKPTFIPLLLPMKVEEEWKGEPS